uniref:Capsid protein n=1 Tax=Erysiphe necator associated chrysovirus 3 TaxID=2742544 RepID=A0A8E3YWE9_9VIRU|nr:capsid protein [Erysiphe necator associated chrysovirus 3]
MSQISYDNSKYAEKNLAFNKIREGASALRRAKAHRTKVQLWNPATREGTSTHREKIVTLGRDVGATAAYFDNKRSSALEVICEDKFTLHYQLYGDISREAVHGQNTISIFSEVTWDRCEVAAGLYPGPLDEVQGREKLVAAAREGIPNRDDVSKVTSWSRDAVRALQDEDLAMFKVLLENVVVGQSKLTRLVKGFLMLLECMDRGSFDVELDVQNAIVYNPRDVVNSFRHGDRSYVFNSRPTSNPHTAVLWRMCGAYPPPELNTSHVTIPADATHNYMVVQGQLGAQGSNVHLTPGLIYASLMTYALDVGCTEHLQQALIIACSLQQNRYFSRVKLPSVVSSFDLMVPGFLKINTRLDKPIITREMGVSIGRLHQMLMFMNIKDILTSAELSTASGFDPSVSMRTYLSSQATLIKQMAGDISSLNLLEATLKMKVHELLREDDFSDLLNISAFEGLWLCDENTRSVDNGVLAALSNGVYDMSGNVTSFDVVKREMDLGNIVYKERDIPHGSFTVRWVCVTKTENSRVPLPRKRVSKPMALVHPCDKVPGSSLRSTKKKRFGPSYNTKPAPVVQATTVPPIRKVVTSPQRTKTRSPSVQSDPSYHEVIEPHSPLTDSPPPVYQSPESSRESESSSDVAVHKATRLAHEAMATVTEAISTAADSRKVDRIVKDTAGQVLAIDAIKRLRDESNVKLSHKEMGSLAMIVEAVGLDFKAAHAKDFGDLIGTMEKNGSFINYAGEGMVGSSNIAKEINEMIDKGSSRNTFGSVRRSMLKDKVTWAGNVEDAPKDGLRYICNSPTWLRYLEAHDVDREERDVESDRPMSQILAEILSRSNKDLLTRDVNRIYLWIRNANPGHFPLEITSEELEGVGPPDTLNYKQNPASFGQRKVNEEDSRWVIMACKVNRPIFTKELLIKLTKEFMLTPQMMQNLRRTYGLFERKQ